jgi:hypothetical protein
MSQDTIASNVMQEFDTEFLLNAPELYIFAACRHVVELLQSAHFAAKCDEVESSTRNERVGRLLSELQALAQATERFDILVPFTSETGFSKFFWRWYNWWNDYREKLTEEELELVHQLQDACDPGALQYRPRGHWLRRRATPATGF